MPIWDSVQRGLEKASQEALRIAKMQRLRSTIDNLSRQMNIQSSNLVNKTMELFLNGQLSQSELLSICQEMAYLKQQIDDAQNELRQVQASQSVTPAGQPEGPGTYPPTMPAGPMPYAPSTMESNSELPPTVYAPPPPGYETYFESSSDVAPPPPPGVEPLTISAIDTVLMGASPSSSTSSAPESEKRLCPACHAEVQPEHAFCHNCGTLIQYSDSQHQPTARAGMPELAYQGGEQTVQTDETSQAPGNMASLPMTDPSS